MRLEMMYTNILTLSMEELIQKVESDSFRRTKMLRLSEMSKIDTSGKTKTERVVLTEEEKRLMKMLGLKSKDIKALRATSN